MPGAWRTKAKAVAVTVGAGLLVREVLRRLRRADLTGQVALVTGGSRGLGFLLAKELAREGCRVAICARGRAALERARQELEGMGAEAMAVQCDVSDRTQVERMVDEVTHRFGRVDILVNNAGIIQVGPVQTMTLQDFQDAMAVIFWGTFYPTMAVLPQMLERRSGRIVNVTSIGGKVGVPHVLPYTCAKFAAVGFSEGLRVELARDGVSVITIVPGLMRTGSYLNVPFKGHKEMELTWFALGSSLPLTTMSAERAARAIVEATKRGEAETVLSLPANVLARFHGLFPGTTQELLALVDRFVLPPHDVSDTSAERGWEVQRRMRSAWLDFLTGLGLAAAQRLHELPETEEKGPSP